MRTTVVVPIVGSVGKAVFALCVGLMLTAVGQGAETASAKTFFVADSGNDRWSGTLPSPNEAKTDGPFATFERARDAIRALKQKSGLPAGGVTVEIRGGIYERANALELTAQDSGAADAPIVYRAREGEVVRWSGGCRLGGFQRTTDPAILARLDEAARGKVVQVDLRRLGITDFGDFGSNRLELFFQDQPMTMSRWPNQGFVNIMDLVGGNPVDVRGTKGDKIGKFMYEGDRPKRWTAENDVWVHGYWFWDWSDQRHKVESIDTDKRIISVEPPYHNYGYRKGQWFYAFNLLSEIDQPGEWYLDRKTGILYFWPPSPIRDGMAAVTLAKNLVTMKDVSYVTLEGLTLEFSRATAVVIRGGTENRVAGCTLRNLGDAAVSITDATQSGVVSCDIFNLGAGGVHLAGGDRKTLTPAGLFADNNHIHDYGRWKRMYSPAINLSGVGNRASHNLIHDAPHQAMNFSGNDHLIEFNEIHHVCLESNDAGAIYAGRDWTQRGHMIRYNFMHHVTGFQNETRRRPGGLIMHGCMGIYLDDSYSSATMFGNVFYRVCRAAFIGGGRDNVVENNLFVDCMPAVHVDARALGWAAGAVNGVLKQRLDAMPYQSDLWRSRYPKLVNIWEDEPAIPKGNIIARNACQGGQWSRIEKKAEPYVALQDNLIAPDLGVVSVNEMNFQLRSDSPVYQKIPGFQKIPFEQIGLAKDQYRKNLPPRGQ
jgi:hypothetical protein